MDTNPIVQFLDGNLIYIACGALLIGLIARWIFGPSDRGSAGGGDGGFWDGGGDGGGGGGE